MRRDERTSRLDQGPLLYWEFIRWAQSVGGDVIDWGGTGTSYPPQETNPGYGVYRFNSGSDRRSGT